jgi:hypothetical protein
MRFFRSIPVDLRADPGLRLVALSADCSAAVTKTLVSMDGGQLMLIDETGMRHSFAGTPFPNIDAPAMLRPERRSVTDRDNRGAGQPFAQQPIDHALGWLIERSCGLIKKQPIGLEEDAPNNRQTLLFAEREVLLPMGLLVEAVGERR